MEWEAIKLWLETSESWIGPGAALVGIVISVFGVAWLIIKFIASSAKPPPKPENNNQAVEAILDKLEAATKDKDIAEQERDALRKAMGSLQNQFGPEHNDAHEKEREQALEALKAGQTHEAETLFRSIAGEREKIGAKINREAAEAWRHVGALVFLHDTQNALAAYTRAVDLDSDNPDGWNQLGQLQKRLGKLAAAENSYLKVLSLGDRATDKTVIAIATGNLGVIYQMYDELDKAEEMFLNSLELNKKLDRKEGMASQYGNLGLVHQKRDDLDMAEEMLVNSLELNKELGRKVGMANQYNNLGAIHLKRGNLDNAEEMLQKSLELNKELGRQEGMASDYGNLGVVHQTRGDLDNAEEMFLKSLELNKELGHKEGMANNYGNLGALYETRGDLDSACQNWRKSRDLFADIGMPHMVEKVEGTMNKAGCAVE